MLPSGWMAGNLPVEHCRVGAVEGPSSRQRWVARFQHRGGDLGRLREAFPLDDRPIARPLWRAYGEACYLCQHSVFLG